jgi:hypothetical protein
MPIDGEEEIPETLATTDNWRDDTLMVGVYGYVGDSILPGGKDKAGKDITYENDFFRGGVDLRGRYRDLEVLAGAILGQDDDPDNTGKAVDSLGFFVEADYLFKPWLIGVARFGQLSFDDPNEKRNDFFTFTPNITILARPNVRLTLEALIQVEDVDKENKDNLRWIKGNVLYVF